jgi:hypothetical protein
VYPHHRSSAVCVGSASTTVWNGFLDPVSLLLDGRD